MEWVQRPLSVGDMLRIPMRILYHYGIYVGEDKVVQFGEPILDSPIPPGEVRVMITDVASFSGGQPICVADFNEEEMRSKRSADEIAEYAKSRIGDGGYHVIYNNCEHFASQCVFGVSRSLLVDDVRLDMSQKLPPIYVYVARTEEYKETECVPDYIAEDLKRVKSEKVADEKKAAYGILARAFEMGLGRELEIEKCYRDENGKPCYEDAFFSVSHSDGLVAVAVSGINVGVDIELVITEERAKRLRPRVVHPNEAESSDFTLLWTKKEALYKVNGKPPFVPKDIDTFQKKTKSVSVLCDGREYRLSVAADNLMNVRWKKDLLPDSEINYIK